MSEYIVEMRHITKRFPGIIANNDVSIGIRNAMAYLSQAYLLDQQIRTKLQQIASLRSLSGTMQSFAGAGPVVHTRNVTSLEDTVLKIMAVDAILDKRGGTDGGPDEIVV